MIISKDINPERDFYYLGAKTIVIISELKSHDINFFDVFEKLNKTEKISVNLFTYTLDWLYLIGAVKKTDSGKIIKCF